MTFQLKHPNDFPSDAFSALLKVNPDQREMLQRYLGCSDEIQLVVRQMYAVLVNENVSDEDRQRAVATIMDALHLNPEKGHGNYGFDLTKIERQTATEHPEVNRRPLIAQRLEQLDSQEATFAERLRQLLEQKNIKQEELAERIDCTQSAISKMLTRNARPHKKTIFKLAAALNVEPTDLWPDLEVAAILDSIVEFPQERELTAAQAAALDAAAARPPAKNKGRDLPSRKRN